MATPFVSLSLHDGWTFRDAAAAEWLPAVVPGCVHRDLLRAGKIPDPFYAANERQVQGLEERAWEYRLTFDAPAAALAHEEVDLVAEGLDTIATVTLNGAQLGRSETMFVSHRWPAKSRLRPTGNELVIRFDSAMEYIRTHRTEHVAPVEFNDPVGGCTRIRKQQCQFGWDWGPRLVTAGIWKPIRLEAWSGNRLRAVRVTQTHAADGAVSLAWLPELARADRSGRFSTRARLTLRGQEVASSEGASLMVAKPELWWPNGHGAQPLYTLEVELLERGQVIDRWSRRLGLRTILLERQRDAWGESFRFVVNGRPIFAKGANWIPAHSLVAGLTRADYAVSLEAAAAAHMNMLRVWGGGIYEHEEFYDLCDELGLLVWQDFIFACTFYPADEAFLALVRAEAEGQIERLRHRACLALWCGNNEIEQLNLKLVTEEPTRSRYRSLFETLLPAVVAERDSVTAYWPSSAHGTQTEPEAARKAGCWGDTHFWDVWHSRKPVKNYEKTEFRFVSEFGMQSYSSPEVARTYCPPEQLNVFAPAMEAHQRNAAGNQIILDYVSRLYRFPRDYAALAYLSQLNQAHCMQVAVEHFRRSMPRTMGALYWQLNDCWPVASWSSLEFGGKWKALHHAARRFFAPALVSAHVPGEEKQGTGNLRKSTVDFADLYTVYDGLGERPARLVWEWRHLDGRILEAGAEPVLLRPGESVNRRRVEFAPIVAAHGRESAYLRVALESGEGKSTEVLSEETVFLAPPRFLELPRARAEATWERAGERALVVTLLSPVFQHRFSFELEGFRFQASDNFFELYPGRPKRVRLEFAAAVDPAGVAQAFATRSLVDSY